jgi:hypothetical protein
MAILCSGQYAVLLVRAEAVRDVGALDSEPDHLWLGRRCFRIRCCCHRRTAAAVSERELQEVLPGHRIAHCAQLWLWFRLPEMHDAICQSMKSYMVATMTCVYSYG